MTQTRIMHIDTFIRLEEHPPLADKSAPTAVWMNVSMCIIGPYGCPDYLVKVHYWVRSKKASSETATTFV